MTRPRLATMRISCALAANCRNIRLIVSDFVAPEISYPRKTPRRLIEMSATVVPIGMRWNKHRRTAVKVKVVTTTFFSSPASVVCALISTDPPYMPVSLLTRLAIEYRIFANNHATRRKGKHENLNGHIKLDDEGFFLQHS